MEFEAGPWTSFGEEILEQLDELVNGELSDETGSSSLSGNTFASS